MARTRYPRRRSRALEPQHCELSILFRPQASFACGNASCGGQIMPASTILIVIGAAICCLLAAFALRQHPNASFGLLLICILIGPVVVLSVGAKTVPLLFADLYLPSWLLVAV